MADDIPCLSLRESIKLEIPGEEQEGLYFLTTFSENDAEALQECLSIDAVSDSLIRIPKPYTLDHARFWISALLAEKSALFALPDMHARHAAIFTNAYHIPLQVMRHNGRLIGACTLSPRADATAADIVELGYYLHPAYQGKRIVYAAVVKLLEYAREEFGVARVYASADCKNERSRRVLERLVRDTAVGEVKSGQVLLKWPSEKRVHGRESDSLSWFWEWSIC